MTYRLLPEAIPGLAAYLYATTAGRAGRPAQERVAEAVVAALPSGPRHVLDMGCGPGWLAIAIARRRPDVQVVAVDLSEAMVRIARRNGRGVPNLEVRREHGAHLSAADESTDFVVSAESMHHWREPLAVLDEMCRVLRPDGRAWIFDGRDDFEAADLEGWTIAGPRRPPRAVVWLVRAVLGAHGFSRRDWESRVPELARASRFGGGAVEPFGFYRRLELVRGSG